MNSESYERPNFGYQLRNPYLASADEAGGDTFNSWVRSPDDNGYNSGYDFGYQPTPSFTGGTDGMSLGLEQDGGQPGMAMQQPEMAMQQPGMEEMAMQQPPAQSMEGDELVQEVTQALQQGADPQAVMEELVQLGISQEEASQLIGSIMQQMQGQGQQMQMAQYGNMEQVYDVDDNVMEKLIAAGAGIEII